MEAQPIQKALEHKQKLRLMYLLNNLVEEWKRKFNRWIKLRTFKHTGQKKFIFVKGTLFFFNVNDILFRYRRQIV